MEKITTISLEFYLYFHFSLVSDVFSTPRNFWPRENYARALLTLSEVTAEEIFFAFVIINDGAIKRFLKGLKKAKKDNNKPNLPS